MSHTQRPLFHLAVIEGCDVRAACGDSDPSCGWTPTARAVTCEACLARMPAVLFAPAARIRRGGPPPRMLARTG